MAGESKWYVRMSPAIVSVALVIVYPLSVGPAAWLSDSISINEDDWIHRTEAAIYRPLVLATERTHTEGMLVDYLRWFVDYDLRYNRPHTAAR